MDPESEPQTPMLEPPAPTTRGPGPTKEAEGPDAEHVPPTNVLVRGKDWFLGHTSTARVLREASIALALLYAYRFGRGLVAGHEEAARQHALTLIGWEQALGIFREHAWQQFFLDKQHLMAGLNWYYEWVHFPATGLLLAWAFWWHYDKYHLVRNTLALSTVFAFLFHWTWPLMPPRMLPEYGFTDTVAAGIYADDNLGAFTNQLAAMPSLHFGWAFLIGVAVCAISTSRFRWIFLLHPVITLVAIVATANHYFLDAILVVPIIAGSYWIANSKWFQDLLPGSTPPEALAKQAQEPTAASGTTEGNDA